MTPQPIKLSDLRPAERNPRSIQPENAKALGYSMQEFGDLSGIVFNLRTKELVCGHQRVHQLVEKFGELPIKQIDDVSAYMETPVGRFNVTLVDWPIEKQWAGNIAANSPTTQGVFTPDVTLMLEDIERSNEQYFSGLDLEFLPAPSESDFFLGNHDNRHNKTAAPGATDAGAAATDERGSKDIENYNPHDKETYLNNPIKQIVLFLETSQYGDTLHRLEAAGEYFGTDNNTDTVLRLLDYYEGKAA